MTARGASLIDQGAGSICDTRVASVAEIDAWLRSARAGDRFVYCTGPELVRGPAAARAGQLYREGLVDLAQPWARHCVGRDFMMERRSTPLARSEPAAAPDHATEALLRTLKRAANFDQRCPSDTELARAVGLATRNQVAWRLKKLALAGAIKSDTIESGPEAGWRTITIVASGRQTLPPPSVRALKRSIAEVGE